MAHQQAESVHLGIDYEPDPRLDRPQPGHTLAREILDHWLR